MLLDSANQHLTPTQLSQEMFDHSVFMIGYEIGEIMKLKRHSLERRWKGTFILHKAMVCIRQWMLQLFPSILKSLGRSCEQLLCGMSAVHGALGGCSGQHFPSQAGRDTRCSCTCVPSCVRIIAGRVYSTAGLCVLFIPSDADTAGPGESLLASLFFEDTGRISTPHRVFSGH